MKRISLIITLIAIALIIIFYNSNKNKQQWQINSDTYKFDKIANNVYVIHGPLDEPNEENGGFMNNPALIVSENSLIIIDPGSAYQVGKKLLNKISKISSKKISAVFNTHIHGDHWLANQAISEKFPQVKIYASKKMINEAKDG